MSAKVELLSLSRRQVQEIALPVAEVMAIMERALRERTLQTVGMRPRT